MKKQKEDKLKQLRERINLIDEKIIELLKERLRIADKIIKFKIKKGLNLTDKKREKEIIESLVRKVKNPILKKYLPQIYKIIFKISKEKYKKK